MVSSLHTLGPVKTPPSDRARKDLAHALVQKGRLKEALAHYGELSTANPSDSNLLLQCAQLAKRLNQPTRAVTAWWSAAKLLHAAGHDGRARAALACALELAPNDLNLQRAQEAWRDGAPPIRRLSLVQPVVLGDDELPTDPFIPSFSEPTRRPELDRATVFARPARRAQR
jgi:tetratricopeptide (TPR) repeat protein